MRRVFQCLVAFSLILAVGGHWAAIQSVAWVGMAVSYSQNDPLLVALEKTFDGEHPCRLCKVVDEGKKQERQQATFKAENKLDFFCLGIVSAVYPPRLEERSLPECFLITSRSESPPVPPPRIA